MRKIKFILISIVNEYLNYYVNNLFLLVFPIVLVLLGMSSWLYLVILIIYLFFIFKRYDKRLIVTVLFLLAIIVISYSINNKVYDVNRYKNQELEITGQINNKKKYNESYYRYQVKTRIDNRLFKKTIYVYCKDAYEIGDVIYSKGIVNEIDGEKIEHQFDYESYLNKNKIYLVLSATETKKEYSHFTISIIRKYANDYFENHFEGDTLIVLKGLILGDSSDFSNSLKTCLKENGILHLFAVSGLHISLFILLISLLLSMFKIKDEWSEAIILIFLFIYIILTSFSISILRAGLMYFFSIINKRLFDKTFSSMDVISFTFLVLVLINPFSAYNTGFILSFTVSFTIVLLSSLLKGKNNSYQILVISLISNIVTIPIIININYEYNLLTPILNVLYINLVSIFILPFAFICVALPILSYALDIVVNWFLKLIDFTSNISLRITLPHMNSVHIIIFYSLVLLLIILYFNKKYKRIVYSLMFVFLLFLSLFAHFSFNPEIDFLYLNDGDATIITYLNQVIVIDTGDGTNDEVLNAIKSKGIRKIDYLFITHCHNDHNGGVEAIEENIEVNKIVTSEYYNYHYNNQMYVKANDRIVLKGMELLVLGPSIRREEENNNCLILLLKIQNKTILFMADATTVEESDVITNLKKNSIDKVDVIKIGHHGSTTSTGEELLNCLKINYAIIMVGKKRKLTHPSSEVLNRLDNKRISYLITTENYSIKIKIRKREGIYFYTLKD